MTISVRVADDPERFRETDLVVWAEGHNAESTEIALLSLAPEQRFAAVSDEPVAQSDCYAGVYGAYDLELSIPGSLQSVRLVPASGLTWVGVHPDERRRGVLTAMIRDHFERTVGREQSGLSILHASEPAIYGRYGYGIASRECKITLGKGTTLDAPTLEEEARGITTRLLAAQAPGVPARTRDAARAAAATVHGQIVRELHTYAGFVHEGPESLRDKEPLRVLIATKDGQDVGYAWFRRKPKWENHQVQGTVGCGEMFGTPAAELAIARRLLELDLMTKVEFDTRPADDLLGHWAGSARGTAGPAADCLWLRLVDLPTAMSARGYAAAGEIVLEISDTFLPEQGGRWRLSATADGAGGVERTQDAAEVELSTQQLAGAYLGDGSLPQRLRAGLLIEHRAGAVNELDRLLRMPTAPGAAGGF